MSAASSERPPPHKVPTSKKCYICDEWYTNLHKHVRDMHGESFICPYCIQRNKSKPKHYSLEEFNKHMMSHHTEEEILKYVENLNKTLSVLQMAQAEAAERAGRKVAERDAIRAAAESSKREAAAAKAAAKAAIAESYKRESEAAKAAADRAAHKNGVLHLLRFTQAAFENYAEKEAANQAAQSLVDVRTNQAAYALMSMRGHNANRSRNRSPKRNNTKRRGGNRRKTQRLAPTKGWTSLNSQ